MTTKFKETCPKRGSWCSFRLVDEHGEGTPYARLDYTLHDRMGMAYTGTLDAEGYARLENFYLGPLILDLSMAYQSGEKWYENLVEREHFPLPLTALQVAAEQSPTGPRIDGRTYKARERAEKEQAVFFQVEVGDFVKPGDAAHLPEADTTLNSCPSPFLKEACTHSNTQPGIALMVNKHNVLEVKALRAYNPLLSHNKGFCALNAYHLSIMSLLSYAPFHKDRTYNEDPTPPPYKEAGCIGAVLQSQLARCERPTRFSDGGPYHLLTEEVPYSKRLEVVPYNPVRYAKEAKEGWAYPEKVHFLHDESDNQAFITHNDKVVLISVRGTAGLKDALRDMDAKQVPYLADEGGKGNAHRGFYDSFEVTRKFVERYMDAFYTGNQTIMVCGHSLGGAIALLLAEWLRQKYSDDIQLYTIGAPRAGNQSFVKSAASLTHHRIVNHNDPVPGVPSTWMDAEWKMVLPGTTLLIASIGSPWIGLMLTLGGLLNLKDDNYEHHGEQWHFMPRKPGKNSVLWQPRCAAIEQKTCAEFAAHIELKGDMPKRAAFLMQALSAAEHSSDGGYSRNALTTLLRWHASVQHRGGKLLTPDEREQIEKQIKPLRAEMEKPINLSYERFRHNLRSRPHPRLSQTSEVELRGLFRTSQQHLESLQSDQTKSLSRAQARLKNQDEHRLGWQHVFGDIPKSDELIKLIDEWLDRPENKKAAELAKVSSPSDQQQAYA
ncbi:lipase family protein [Pseudomonas sp. MYb193]|uniref:lipase family protein n=1 Tax=Pseudomonas sp. MYb193 TaxID=1827300 RepID=UPI00211461F6|nr:lipase family protein [Pseudomonas sp. MYb193]